MPGPAKITVKADQMMKHKIAPSFLSADARNWADEIRLVEKEGITELHLDVMDGQFVPNISFGAGPIKMLRSVSSIAFDAHLMVLEPASLLPAFVDAGVDAITVHAEACKHLHKTLQYIKEAGILAGVALNPATPVCQIEPILDMVDRVLVMTVNPGFGGQKTIISMLSKLEQLKKLRDQHGYHFELQADGGINQENITQFMAAGAENLVVGSALFQQGKTAENIQAFHKIILDYEKQLQ